MNRAKEFRGKCTGCGAQYAGSQMGKHLASCIAGNSGPQKTLGKDGKVFGLKVEGPGYAGTYWLFLEAPAELALLDLDRFLRDVWLECCGHCSAFTIGNVRYEPSKPPNLLDWGPSQPTRRMAVPLGEVLLPGVTFRYEYDFGTTTELGLKVLWEKKGEARRDGISILARNEAPALACGSCKAAAEWVCAECIQEYGKDACYCSRCVSRHGCDEEMSLPVVNSPRMGACGYTGPRKDSPAATRGGRTWAPSANVVKVERKRR